LVETFISLCPFIQWSMVCIGSRAARFFFGATYQNGENVPNDDKINQMVILIIYKMVIKIPNGHKMNQMTRLF
jgi:hypothetical protein